MEEISIMPGSIRLVSANCAAGIDSKKRVHTGGGGNRSRKTEQE